MSNTRIDAGARRTAPSNARVLLRIESTDGSGELPERPTLVLQANPAGYWEWNFPGTSAGGRFTYTAVPESTIFCHSNRSNTPVMTLNGLPPRSPENFPFLMRDQTEQAAGALLVNAAGLPLQQGSYRWRVYHFVPSGYVQQAW